MCAGCSCVCNQGYDRAGASLREARPLALLYLDDSILLCHRCFVSMGEERDAVDQRLLCIEIYHPIIHPGARELNWITRHPGHRERLCRTRAIDTCFLQDSAESFAKQLGFPDGKTFIYPGCMYQHSSREVSFLAPFNRFTVPNKRGNGVVPHHKRLRLYY